MDASLSWTACSLSFSSDLVRVVVKCLKESGVIYQKKCRQVCYSLFCTKQLHYNKHANKTWERDKRNGNELQRRNYKKEKLKKTTLATITREKAEWKASKIVHQRKLKIADIGIKYCLLLNNSPNKKAKSGLTCQKIIRKCHKNLKALTFFIRGKQRRVIRAIFSRFADNSSVASCRPLLYI